MCIHECVHVDAHTGVVLGHFPPELLRQSPLKQLARAAEQKAPGIYMSLPGAGIT